MADNQHANPTNQSFWIALTIGMVVENPKRELSDSTNLKRLAYEAWNWCYRRPTQIRVCGGNRLGGSLPAQWYYGEDQHEMRLSFVKPRPELQPYVETIWVFESSTGLPVADSSVAAPTGGSRLTFPFNNSLVSVANGRSQTSQPERLYFCGQ